MENTAGIGMRTPHLFYKHELAHLTGTRQNKIAPAHPAYYYFLLGNRDKRVVALAAAESPRPAGQPSLYTTYCLSACTVALELIRRTFVLRSGDTA